MWKMILGCLYSQVPEDPYCSGDLYIYIEHKHSSGLFVYTEYRERPGREQEWLTYIVVQAPHWCGLSMHRERPRITESSPSIV